MSGRLELYYLTPSQISDQAFVYHRLEIIETDSDYIVTEGNYNHRTERWMTSSEKRHFKFIKDFIKFYIIDNNGKQLGEIKRI